MPYIKLLLFITICYFGLLFVLEARVVNLLPSGLVGVVCEPDGVDIDVIVTSAFQSLTAAVIGGLLLAYLVTAELSLYLEGPIYFAIYRNGHN